MKKQKSVYLSILTIAVAAFMLVAFSSANNVSVKESDYSELALTKGDKISKCDGEAKEDKEKKCGEGKKECSDKDKGEKKCGEGEKGEKKCGEGKCGEGDKAEKKCGEGDKDEKKCGE